MNLFNSNKEHISKTEIKDYLNNSLSDKEKHNLENDMLNDPFLADAMEGYEQFPNEIDNIPTLKSNNKKGYFISFLSLLVIGVFLFLFFKSQNNTSKNTPIEDDLIVKNETINNDIQKSTNVDEIGSKNEQKNTPLVTPKKTQKKEEVVTLVRESISLEKYHASPEIYIQERNYDIKKVKLKTIGYYNFLAVDYSVIYTNQSPFEEIELGTPANYSNIETYNLTDDNVINKTQQFTYKEYLKKSFKLLSENQYGNAIHNFSTILKHYPNDVNAQFYSGFANYNLKKYSEAITFFDKVMNNSFDFFYEDAQWYKALSLEQNGRFKEANKLFRLIAKEKGFYATQAAKK